MSKSERRWTKPDGCVCDPRDWYSLKPIPPICKTWRPSTSNTRTCFTCDHEEGCHPVPPEEPEPDKPFTLTLTRADGSTVEVRTRLEWTPDGNGFNVRLRRKNSPEPRIVTDVEIMFIHPTVAAGIYDDWKKAEYDLRAIRSAMEVTE